jgi:hypothetical protein
VGAVEVVVHLAVLSEHILFDLLFEFVLLHKVVLPAVDFALPGPAGGVADTELENGGVFLQQVIDERPLAHP